MGALHTLAAVRRPVRVPPWRPIHIQLYYTLQRLVRGPTRGDGFLFCLQQIAARYTMPPTILRELHIGLRALVQPLSVRAGSVLMEETKGAQVNLFGSFEFNGDGAGSPRRKRRGRAWVNF